MDDKEKIGRPDRDRINLNEPYEVQYWSQKFHITHDTLKVAVQAVGNSAKEVEAYLKSVKPE